MQFLDDATQRLAGVPERARATRRWWCKHEKRHGVLELEGHDLNTAPQAALKRTGQHARQELRCPGGCPGHSDHEGTPPALQAEVPETKQRQVPAQVLGPGPDVRMLGPGSHAVTNPAAHFAPQGTGKLAGCFGSGVFAESLQQKVRQIQSRLTFVVAQLPATQIVDDGAGRVETRGHGRKGACKWQYRARVAQAVKSRATRQPAKRTFGGWICLGLFLGIGSSQEAWGLPASSAPRSVSPSQATRRCSPTRPVCVEGSEPALVTRALGWLTEAYETTVLGNQGPSWALDRLGEPMVWRLGHGALTFEITRAAQLGFDRGRTLCAGGEVTRSTALACAAGSSLGRIAPATTPALLRGAADYLALTYAPDEPRPPVRAPIEPERGLLGDATEPADPLLFDRVAAKATIGRSVTAVWLGFVLAATRSEPGAARMNAEPDFFDVLGRTLGERDPHLAQFFDDLAVLRFGQLGPLGTSSEQPEVAWEVDASTLPRNLVLPRPLLPTGSAYVLVHLDPATRRAGLALRTFCENGSRYVWSMARLDERGAIQSRVPVPGRQSATSAEGVLYELDGTHDVVIIGTSLGGSPGRELDPDDAPHPAHSCEVVLNRLQSR